MCSIVGLIDKNGNDVSEQLKKMLAQTEHRGPDGSGIAIGTSAAKAETIEQLDIEKLTGSSGLGHSRLRITGTTGVQPLYSSDSRFVLAFNGEIWNYRELRKQLQALGYTFKTDSDSEVIIHLVSEKFKQTNTFYEAVSKAFAELDGEFALVVLDTLWENFALVRDPVGVKQLYYDENEAYVGFCSEKKPLWNLNLQPKRVLPGEIVEIKGVPSGGFAIEAQANRPLKNSVIKISDENESLEMYKTALFDSVEKRVREQPNIGIIFSGGVDSVMIAQIASQLGADITCYTAGFPDSADVIHAKKVALELGYKIRVNELTEEKIDRELSNIITAIESSNHLQVDVAIPIYFSVKLAKEGGIRVMLTGQGADELFAGYPWYPKIFAEEGARRLTESLWNDIKNLYKDTLEREDKITMYHSIELRVPFLDPEVIYAAMSISEDLKIREKQLKYLHRKLAQTIGIPDYIAWRPKEAAQHGSNVHEALKNVLKKRRRSIPQHRLKERVSRNGSGEALGSAYRYASHKVYEDNECIQQVLDYFGAEIGVY